MKREKTSKSEAVATLAEVARHAGVSQTAASFALSNGPLIKKVSAQTRKAVIEAAQKLAYVPNQVAISLRRQRTQTIGIIFADFYADWAQRVMQGFDSAIDPHGYTPLLARDSWEPQRQRREILSLVGRQVDGLVVIVPMEENLSLLKSISDKGTPVLFFGDFPLKKNAFDFVVWDEAGAVIVALEHLADIGCRNIWFVNPGSLATEHLHLSRARSKAFEGFMDAQKSGSRFTGRIIHSASGTAIGEDVATMVVSDMENAPDAILASNDLLGLQIMESLYARKISIPSDIALMGLCDHPISASLMVDLSSVHQPLEEMARAAGAAIVEMIESPDPPRIRRTFEATQLCIRGSTLRQI